MGKSSEEFMRQRERESNSLPPNVIDDIWRSYFEYINQLKSNYEKRNI
jgi:hypothetical protein|tara:strand:+ start:5825 stop:5968 length:144 start_codon:yes stop_codon:yes gene_type:complete